MKTENANRLQFCTAAASPGFTLPFALLLTTLLSGIFLLLFQFLLIQDIEQKKKVNKKKLDFACYSAVQKLLAQGDHLVEGKDIISIESTEVLISKRQFGLLYTITASAGNLGDTSAVKYTAANLIDPDFTNAMVFSKQNLRATVAGNTLIKGNILATSDRFNLGYIPGLEKTNPDYLNGEINVKEDIPIKKFTDSLLTGNIDYLSNQVEYDQQVQSDFIIDNTNAEEFLQSKKMLIYGNLDISNNVPYYNSESFSLFHVLGKTTIRANSNTQLEFALVCDSTVIIEEGATIKNCTIFSRQEVKIQKRTALQNVQVYSYRGITVKHSDCLYPSILGLYIEASDSASLNSRLNINSSNINGTVFLVSSTVGLSSNLSRITIDKKSNIQGLVYCENDLELLGKVDGTVYTYNLYYYKEPTQYRNWLVSLKINRTELDENFLLPIGFTENTELKILKERWIN